MAPEDGIDFIFPRPCTELDEITLSPSLGRKNQILIKANQTLQIIEECRKGERNWTSAHWVHSWHVGAFKVLSCLFAEVEISEY